MILELGDGGRWDFDAADSRSGMLLGQLAEVMMLGDAVCGSAAGRPSWPFRVTTAADALRVEVGPAGERYAFSASNFTAMNLSSPETEARGIPRLVALSLVIAAQVQSGGGLLLHGALAAKGGVGVLLAGPSGRGKSTAIGRLRAPWESLCDDMALVVPRVTGSWEAHPWPTWSSFVAGGNGGAWNVQRGVGLRGMFFMAWAAVDRVERIGGGRAACLLVEAYEQAWVNGRALLPPARMAQLRGQAFGSISALASSVPTFMLHLSPDGPFWEKIEEALGEVPSQG